jgi:tRNA threonylcarbamoyladenosine biosynthesis protein TsaB
MLLLGVDTSGRDGSVALARADANSFDLIELAELAGGTYSAQLVPTISRLLQNHQLQKTDIDAFAVATGPGSFTGLRVGLSAIKALAEILHKPIATVSVLEAVASAANYDGPVIAALDAMRKEVYAGEYDVHGGEIRCVRESLLGHAQFAELVETHSSAQLITPDATVPEIVPAHLLVKQIERPRADVYARLGARKIVAGNTVTPETLEANYIRRSDAEIFSKPIL